MICVLMIYLISSSISILIIFIMLMDFYSAYGLHVIQFFSSAYIAVFGQQKFKPCVTKDFLIMLIL